MQVTAFMYEDEHERCFWHVIITEKKQIEQYAEKRMVGNVLVTHRKRERRTETKTENVFTTEKRQSKKYVGIRMVGKPIHSLVVVLTWAYTEHYTRLLRHGLPITPIEGIMFFDQYGHAIKMPHDRKSKQ
jgi:hypothetical protein